MTIVFGPKEVAHPLRRSHGGYTHQRINTREAEVIHFLYYRAKRPITQIAAILGRSTATVWKVKNGLHRTATDYRQRTTHLKKMLSQSFKFARTLLTWRLVSYIAGFYASIQEALGEDGEPP